MHEIPYIAQRGITRRGRRRRRKSLFVCLLVCFEGRGLVRQSLEAWKQWVWERNRGAHWVNLAPPPLGGFVTRAFEETRKGIDMGGFIYGYRGTPEEKTIHGVSRVSEAGKVDGCPLEHGEGVDYQFSRPLLR